MPRWPDSPFLTGPDACVLELLWGPHQQGMKPLLLAACSLGLALQKRGSTSRGGLVSPNRHWVTPGTEGQEIVGTHRVRLRRRHPNHSHNNDPVPAKVPRSLGNSSGQPSLCNSGSLDLVACVGLLTGRGQGHAGPVYSCTQ